MELEKYFKNNNTDCLEISLNKNIHIFIQKYNESELCIELNDKEGHCININDYVYITLNTKKKDIKKIVNDYLINNYFYSYA